MLWPIWDRSLIRGKASELIVDSKSVLRRKTQLSVFRRLHLIIGVVWLFYCTTSRLILPGVTSGDTGSQLLEFTFCFTDVTGRIVFMIFLYYREGVVFNWITPGKKPYIAVMFWIHVNPALRRSLMWFSWQLLIRTVNKHDSERVQSEQKIVNRGCLSLNSKDFELMSWCLCLRLLVMLWCPKGPPSVTVQAQWATLALAQHPPGSINIPQSFHNKPKHRSSLLHFAINKTCNHRH